MQDKELGGRKIDVHFSSPKEADLDTPCDKTKNQVFTGIFIMLINYQGTLLVTVKNDTRPIDNTELNTFFSKWGKIKVVRGYKDHRA